MTIQSFDIGDTVRFSVAFTNAAGAAADPTTTTFRWKSPSGTEDSYVYPSDAQIVKDSTGAFHVDLVVAADSGSLSWRWVGTGAVGAADEGFVEVRESRFDVP